MLKHGAAESTDPLFSWKTKVFTGLISNHVIGDATNEGDRGLGRPVGEEPGKSPGCFLRIFGKVDSTKIGPVCTRDEFDSGGFVEDGREGVGERHQEGRGERQKQQANGTDETGRPSRKRGHLGGR